MIGIQVDPTERRAACEFFELFKTPWEFCRENREYDVLLVTTDSGHHVNARLKVIYRGQRSSWDEQFDNLTIRDCADGSIVEYEGNPLPLYTSSCRFRDRGDNVLSDRVTKQCAAFTERSGSRAVARIGYNLFSEIERLLNDGQPIENAASPAFELHIEILRKLIISSGLELAEIPPVPEGFRFIACLTHDVDHPSLRAHKWDHTFFGFLFRALVGSCKRFIAGQLSLRAVFVNWLAALKAPLVCLGLAKDFWLEFATRYRKLERGLRSTYFVLPFKGIPGQTRIGVAPAFRASGYGAQEIAKTIQELVSANAEIGLHGIDAWADSARGKEELKEIGRLTGANETGVRMHWLYYDRESPQLLEQAGASYDSTVGYNETVGYRAGTTQVYKPFGTERLLELPLHVMDTALFYPTRMELSHKQARARIEEMYETVEQYGGVLTVNWHDRSVLPERLWTEVYSDMISQMKNRGAWFATASEAVAWFRKRRSAKFEIDEATGQIVKISTAAGDRRDIPGLQVRCHSQNSRPEAQQLARKSGKSISIVEEHTDPASLQTLS